MLRGDRIWQEKLSGKNVDRRELQDCLAFARPNDVVVITQLWRPGRNFQDLISIVGRLRQHESGFKSLHEAPTPPGGRMTPVLQRRRDDWVADRLEKILEQPQPGPGKVPFPVAQVIQRLMDPTDAISEDQYRGGALETLNASLAREGFKASRTRPLRRRKRNPRSAPLLRRPHPSPQDPRRAASGTARVAQISDRAPAGR
jgi:hypothetical protein